MSLLRSSPADGNEKNRSRIARALTKNRYLSDKQTQAYLLAREVIRRVQHASEVWFQGVRSR